MRAGSCNVEVDQFCYEVQPGEGRLAKCLDDQLVEEGKASYKGAKVTDSCNAELDKFKIERAGNINKDVPLAEACLKVRPAPLPSACRASVCKLMHQLQASGRQSSACVVRARASSRLPRRPA